MKLSSTPTPRSLQAESSLSSKQKPRIVWMGAANVAAQGWKQTLGKKLICPSWVMGEALIKRAKIDAQLASKSRKWMQKTEHEVSVWHFHTPAKWKPHHFLPCLFFFFFSTSPSLRKLLWQIPFPVSQAIKGLFVKLISSCSIYLTGKLGNNPAEKGFIFSTIKMTTFSLFFSTVLERWLREHWSIQRLHTKVSWDVKEA